MMKHSSRADRTFTGFISWIDTLRVFYNSKSVNQTKDTFTRIHQVLSKQCIQFSRLTTRRQCGTRVALTLPQKM